VTHSSPLGVATPSRSLVSLVRIAGALTLLEAGHRVWHLVRDDDPLIPGLGWSTVLFALLLLVAGGIAILDRWGPAGAAFLVGVLLPFCVGVWASLVELEALQRGTGITVSPSRTPWSWWAVGVQLLVAVVLAALATGVRPDVRRLRVDTVGLVTVAVALGFVVWRYAEQRLGRWHDDQGAAGVPYDVLVAASVLVPLVWGLALPQPLRKLLLVGWAIVEGLDWARWLEPHVSQRATPWMFLAGPLLLLAVYSALRTAPAAPRPRRAGRPDVLI
jgi:hypothetical protein